MTATAKKSNPLVALAFILFALAVVIRGAQAGIHALEGHNSAAAAPTTSNAVTTVAATNTPLDNQFRADTASMLVIVNQTTADASNQDLGASLTDCAALRGSFATWSADVANINATNPNLFASLGIDATASSNSVSGMLASCAQLGG
jgi:hypothetical protein